MREAYVEALKLESDSRMLRRSARRQCAALLRLMEESELLSGNVRRFTLAPLLASRLRARVRAWSCLEGARRGSIKTRSELSAAVNTRSISRPYSRLMNSGFWVETDTPIYAARFVLTNPASAVSSPRKRGVHDALGTFA
jgi:hypothetical protein